MSLLVSIIIHAALACVAVWWTLYRVGGLGGGGGGLIEVSVIGDGNVIGLIRSGDSVRPTRPNIVSKKIDAMSFDDSPDQENKETDGSEGAVGSGEGGAGGEASGTGFGSGEGRADPRLVTIWKKINRAKYYPEAARQSGTEGAPKVAFNIDLNGKVGGLRIVKSCGNEVLDRAALETVKRSSPLPFYPKPITIAVRYSLKDR